MNYMDFRPETWYLADKENLRNPIRTKDDSSPRVVSILKSSQKFNCFPSEKRQTKVSFKNSPTCHNYNTAHCKLQQSFEWEEIRELDDESNWTERTQIVTKEDHKLYIEAAKEFLDKIVSDLPCFRDTQTTDNMNSSSEFPEVESGIDIGVSPDAYDDNDVALSLGNLQLPKVPDQELQQGMNAEFSYLQVNSGDYPRTFSPIGSERTSPEQDNLMDSNEDIDKLLAPHDNLPENGDQDFEVLPAENNRPDNLLKEITSEKHCYKSAQLFRVNPSDLENEFTGNAYHGGSDLASSKTQEVEDTFQSLAESQGEEEDQFRDEDFRSADQAMWELDYLEKCGNNSKGIGMSALARQSLYVKFDPLVKGATPPSPAKNTMGLRDVSVNKPLSMGDNLLLMDSPQPQLKSSVVPRRPRAAQAKPASPCGVDKLLIFSPRMDEGMKTESSSQVSEKVEEQTTVDTQGTTESDTADAKEEDRFRHKALYFSKEEFDAAVKRESEALCKQLQEECAIREMENKDLTERNEQLKRETSELRVVMQDYEKTIADMIESNQKSQDQYNHSASEVAKERDQLQADLTAVETAFSDLHRRYEKLKGVVENFKKNEEILKKATSDYQEKLKKSEEKYRLLKKHAEEKIESANIEISRVRKTNESEIAVMKAALKKEQTKTASLEMSLQQKNSENSELTAICDELISKMGGQR